MKKLFKIALIAFVTVLAFNVSAIAQEWHVTLVKGDELKGTADTHMSVFNGANGDNFIVNGGDTPALALVTGKSIFDYDSNKYVSVLVGFYIDDKLDHKKTVKFYVGGGKADMAIYFPERSGRAFFDEVVDHLKTKGDVRFVAERYTGGDYDVTAKMNPDIKY